MVKGLYVKISQVIPEKKNRREISTSNLERSSLRMFKRLPTNSEKTVEYYLTRITGHVPLI